MRGVWRRSEDGVKQPYFVGLEGGEPFAFAGLWQRLRDGNGEAVETCAILTTDANGLIRSIHPRMPVILRPENHAAWLDPELQDPERIAALLVPRPAAEMVAYPVGLRVNNPIHDDPACRCPAASGEQGRLF